MSFDWKKTVATVAPTIATALGGPLAGMAVKVASEALGIEASEDAIGKAVATGDPEVFLKLKQAENDFTVRLEELGVERERIAAGDRASARDMATKTNLWPQIVLAGTFVVGYFAIIWSMLSGSVSIQGEFKDILILLFGVTVREMTTIMQFFFGSSAGSKSKDAKNLSDAVKAK